MKQNLLFSILLLLSSIQILSAQSQIIDKKNNNPIELATIISKSGVIITTSNLDGYVLINPEVIHQLEAEDTVSIHHISYETRVISGKELLQDDNQIELEERIMQLGEISVKAGEKDFAILYGYFRSYQLDDGVPKYFFDGIVEYYIPITKPSDYKYRLVQHRAFRNEKLINSEKSRLVTVRAREISVPSLSHISTSSRINSGRWQVNSNKITNNGDIIGHFNISQNKVHMNIDNLAPKTDNSFKIAGYNIFVSKNTNNAIFNTEDVKELSFDNLLTDSKYVSAIFGHKKDNFETKIEVLTELFVTKINFVSKKETKGIKTQRGRGFKENSNFYSNYWEELSKYNVPRLETSIKKTLGTELIQY